MLQNSEKKEPRSSGDANSMICDADRGCTCGAGGGIRTHATHKGHRLTVEDSRRELPS
jgi:hypothetical protein